MGSIDDPSRETQSPPVAALRRRTRAIDSDEIASTPVTSSSMDVAPPERLLEVAGMLVLLHASTPEDFALATRVLGTRPGDPGAPGRVVELTLGYEEPRAPKRPPDFAGPYGDHWIDHSGAHFRHHWGLSANIGTDSVELGGPAEGQRRWVAVRNSMLFVLAHLYMQRGRYLLHSAAVHRRATEDADEATLLVVADSGRGKSTLTYAAALAGMTVMGDDMVVVTPAATGVLAQGVPRVLTVPAEVLHEDVDPACVLPGDHRRRVELVDHDLHPGQERITAVVVCDHDSGRGRISSISATDALEQLAAAFVLSALATPMRRWFPTATTLANGPRVSLLHAADPTERAQRAVDLLHEAMKCTHRSGSL